MKISKRAILLIIILTTLFGLFPHYSYSNVFNYDTHIKFYKYSNEEPPKSILLLSAGMNLSFYLNEEGNWQPGYQFGLIFNRRLYKQISLSFPFSYSRIYAAPRNVETKSYAFDGYIYKAFVNRYISIGFLKIPILLSYNFFSTKMYNLSFLIGPGISIAIEDFSKVGKPSDVTFTNEIIGTHNGPPLASSDETFTLSNSGIIVISGIRLNVDRFYFDLLYDFYPYPIKDMHNLNSISLIFSIELGPT